MDFQLLSPSARMIISLKMLANTVCPLLMVVHRRWWLHTKWIESTWGAPHNRLATTIASFDRKWIENSRGAIQQRLKQKRHRQPLWKQSAALWWRRALCDSSLLFSHTQFIHFSFSSSPPFWPSITISFSSPHRFPLCYPGYHNFILYY